MSPTKYFTDNYVHNEVKHLFMRQFRSAKYRYIVSTDNVDLDEYCNAAKNISMLSFLMTIPTAKYSEFLKSSIYCFVSCHEGFMLMMSVLWQFVNCYGRPIITSVSCVSQVIFIMRKPSVQKAPCDSYIRPFTAQKRAIDMNDIARGNADCHLIP